MKTMITVRRGHCTVSLLVTEHGLRDVTRVLGWFDSGYVTWSMCIVALQQID
jgi:hypothetical protein